MKSMYNDRTIQKSFDVNLRDYLNHLEEKLITMYWSNLFVKPFKNELSNSITTLKSINIIILLLSAVFQVRSLSSKLFSIYQQILISKLQTDNKIVQTVMPPREK